MITITRNYFRCRIKDCEENFYSNFIELRRLLKRNQYIRKDIKMVYTSFSDLSKKYFNSKITLLCLKQNIEIRMKKVELVEKTLKEIDAKYQAFKIYGSTELDK